MNLQAIFEIEFYPGHGFLDYSREPVKPYGRLVRSR